MDNNGKTFHYPMLTPPFPSTFGESPVSNAADNILNMLPNQASTFNAFLSTHIHISQLPQLHENNISLVHNSTGSLESHSTDFCANSILNSRSLSPSLSPSLSHHPHQSQTVAIDDISLDTSAHLSVNLHPHASSHSFKEVGFPTISAAGLVNKHGNSLDV